LYVGQKRKDKMQEVRSGERQLQDTARDYHNVWMKLCRLCERRALVLNQPIKGSGHTCAQEKRVARGERASQEKNQQQSEKTPPKKKEQTERIIL